MLSLFYGPILPSIRDYWKNHSFDYRVIVGKVMSLLFKVLSSFVITFLLRSKCLLIPWLQSPPPKKIKSVTLSIVSPFICYELMGPDAMILVF